MKNLNNNNIIKFTLIYWLLLIVVQVFFDPFTTGRFIDKPEGGFTTKGFVEWGRIFNFAIFIPAVVVLIIKILQWKK